MAIYSVAIRGNNILVGTNGYGIWKRPLSEVTTKVESNLADMPNNFILEQNYPNPFNPVTLIRYGLPQESAVKLVIYNSLGQAVHEINSSVQSAGFHEVNFSAVNLSSGVYYYSLEARATDGSKEFREVKKMMVVK